MANEPVNCKIEHHAILFAYLAKRAIEICGEEGKEAILAGMTTYGNERGQRMAANALAHGDELNTMTNQAYGEWKPDYDGQMEFGQLRTEPTLQTYISKCAWCDSWKKHGLTEFGKLYCVNVDNAVYQGFRSDFVCIPTTTSMSSGEGNVANSTGAIRFLPRKYLPWQKRKRTGNFLYERFQLPYSASKSTICQALIQRLGDDGEKAVELALKDYTDTFGQEYLDVLEGIFPETE